MPESKMAGDDQLLAGVGGISWRWIDLVVWSDLSLAKKASETVMSNPLALEVFAMIEEQSMIFSHYKHVGGVNTEEN